MYKGRILAFMQNHRRQRQTLSSFSVLSVLIQAIINFNVLMLRRLKTRRQTFKDKRPLGKSKSLTSNIDGNSIFIG